ncbi:hypothetical protein SO802_014271 [Lithocarpus litseifolius]|uniref:Uncharacterized protein n=1 Tax=Lithocarpus litseifolius TaxID=425828 RepID=A0AAW2CUJ2_9ROSI
MWASLNPRGTTLFLEEDPKWVQTLHRMPLICVKKMALFFTAHLSRKVPHSGRILTQQPHLGSLVLSAVVVEYQQLSCLFADLPPENETNGCIFIHAEGGLNQQRIAV